MFWQYHTIYCCFDDTVRCFCYSVNTLSFWSLSCSSPVTWWLRPRRWCCPPSPAAFLCTRHVWWAECKAGLETFGAAHRKLQRPPPQAETSWRSPGWWGQNSCCHRGNGKWQRGNRGPVRRNTHGSVTGGRNTSDELPLSKRHILLTEIVIR